MKATARKTIKQQNPLGAIQSLTDAWVRKDAAGMFGWLSDEIIEIGPAFKKALSGKAAFFRHYKNYLTGQLEILSYRIIRPRTVHVSERLAIVYFGYRMQTRENGHVEDSHGKESILVERPRGKWRVRLIHWHRDP